MSGAGLIGLHAMHCGSVGPAVVGMVEVIGLLLIWVGWGRAFAGAGAAVSLVGDLDRVDRGGLVGEDVRAGASLAVEERARAHQSRPDFNRTRPEQNPGVERIWLYNRAAQIE